jgi:hypothetical protein
MAAGSTGGRVQGGRLRHRRPILAGKRSGARSCVASRPARKRTAIPEATSSRSAVGRVWAACGPRVGRVWAARSAVGRVWAVGRAARRWPRVGRAARRWPRVGRAVGGGRVRAERSAVAACGPSGPAVAACGPSGPAVAACGPSGRRRSCAGRAVGRGRVWAVGRGPRSCGLQLPVALCANGSRSGRALRVPEPDSLRNVAAQLHSARLVVRRGANRRRIGRRASALTPNRRATQLPVAFRNDCPCRPDCLVAESTAPNLSRSRPEGEREYAASPRKDQTGAVADDADRVSWIAAIATVFVGSS